MKQFKDNVIYHLTHNKKYFLSDEFLSFIRLKTHLYYFPYYKIRYEGVCHWQAQIGAIEQIKSHETLYDEEGKQYTVNKKKNIATYENQYGDVAFEEHTYCVPKEKFPEVLGIQPHDLQKIIPFLNDQQFLNLSLQDIVADEHIICPAELSFSKIKDNNELLTKIRHHITANISGELIRGIESKITKLDKQLLDEFYYPFYIATYVVKDKHYYYVMDGNDLQNCLVKKNPKIKINEIDILGKMEHPRDYFSKVSSSSFAKSHRANLKKIGIAVIIILLILVIIILIPK